MLKLRPYQIDLKSDIYDAWDKNYKNVLAQLSTAGGKTVIFCDIAVDQALNQGLPTAIQVHRKELLQQICLTLTSIAVPHNIIAPRKTILGIVAAERRMYGKQFYNYKAPITVVSVDTLNARINRHINWAKSIKLWIVDEAAHVLKENKWGRSLEYFPNAKGLGVTATPQRLDKKGLGRHADGVFDTMVFGPTTHELINAGYLSKYKIAIPDSDYKDYLKKASAGADFSHKNRSHASLKSHIVGDVVKNYKKFAFGKQAIVFADSILAGEKMEAEFIKQDISAKLLTGITKDDERLQGIINFRNKDTQVLINVDLFDEGLDCLSEDTEVLTPNGWKLFNTMGGEKTCYAWDPESEKIKISNIQRCFSRDLREGERFLTIKSQHTNIKVTENHNIFYRKKDYYTKSLRSDEYYIGKAKEIKEYSKPFSLPISGEMIFKGVDLTKDELSLMGWAFTDGWLEGGNLVLNQSKPKMIIKIKKILKNLKYSYKESIKTVEELNSQKNKSFKSTMDNHTFFIYVNNRWKEIRHLFNKKDIKSELHNMTKIQFKILWDSMMDGNGSIAKGKTGRLCMIRKNMIDFLSHASSLRGYAMSYGTYLTENRVTVYDIGLRDKTYIQLCQRDKRGAKFNLFKPEGKEKVWCVTNDLGTLITRRKGKIAIIGNCPNIEAVVMARPTMSMSKFLQMCLDQETEILTKRGWLKHDEINKNDLVCGFNIETKQSEWCEIENIINRPRQPDEKMFSLKAPHLDFRVTSKHDMLCKSKGSDDWIKTPIDDMVKRKTLYHVPVSTCDTSKRAKITNAELSFLGWFLSDGSRLKYGKKDECIRIYQCSNTPDKLNHIRLTLKNCGFKWMEFESKRTGELIKYDSIIHFTIPFNEPKRNFKGWENVKGCGYLNKWLNKNISEIYDTLNHNQLKVMLESLNLGDGNKGKVSWVRRTLSITCGDNRLMADRLQSVLVRKGFRCNLHEEDRSYLVNRKNLTMLHIKDVQTSSIAGLNDKNGVVAGKKPYKRSRIIEETDYKKETVWCVTNRLGTIFTRRNDKVLIMGNCGRGLRPLEGKDYLILIDHVGNIQEHDLPCASRNWTLDRIVKRRDKVNLIRICKNPMCNAPYDRLLHICPYCGLEDKPRSNAAGGGRVPLDQVDGDLILLDPDSLRELENDTHLEDPGKIGERVSRAAGGPAGIKAMKNQRTRIETQKELADVIAKWAGKMKFQGYTDRMIHKHFYIHRGMTITQSLSEPRADMLKTIKGLEGVL